MKTINKSHLLWYVGGFLVLIFILMSQDQVTSPLVEYYDENGTIIETTSDDLAGQGWGGRRYYKTSKPRTSWTYRVVSCSDNDGSNLEKKGKLTYKYKSRRGRYYNSARTDKCKNSNTVVENSCSWKTYKRRGRSRNYNYKRHVNYKACELGCKDGACRTLEDFKESKEPVIIKSSKKYQSSKCRTGNKDYFKKEQTYSRHKHTRRTRSYYAKDQCKDANTLNEFYCDSNQKYYRLQETVFCPKGCKDGACVKEPSASKQSINSLPVYAYDEDVLFENPKLNWEDIHLNGKKKYVFKNLDFAKKANYGLGVESFSNKKNYRSENTAKIFCDAKGFTHMVAYEEQALSNCQLSTQVGYNAKNEFVHLYDKVRYTGCLKSVLCSNVKTRDLEEKPTLNKNQMEISSSKFENSIQKNKKYRIAGEDYFSLPKNKRKGVSRMGLDQACRLHAGGPADFWKSNNCFGSAAYASKGWTDATGIFGDMCIETATCHRTYGGVLNLKNRIERIGSDGRGAKKAQSPGGNTPQVIIKHDIPSDTDGGVNQLTKGELYYKGIIYKDSCATTTDRYAKKGGSFNKKDFDTKFTTVDSCTKDCYHAEASYKKQTGFDKYYQVNRVSNCKDGKEIKEFDYIIYEYQPYGATVNTQTHIARADLVAFNKCVKRKTTQFDNTYVLGQNVKWDKLQKGNIITLLVYQDQVMYAFDKSNNDILKKVRSCNNHMNVKKGSRNLYPVKQEIDVKDLSGKDINYYFKV